LIGAVEYQIVTAQLDADPHAALLLLEAPLNSQGHVISKSKEQMLQLAGAPVAVIVYYNPSVIAARSKNVTGNTRRVGIIRIFAVQI